MNIISLALSPRRVGRVLPFAKFYLVDYDSRHLIEKMFRYAIVMPMADDFQAALPEAVPLYVDNHSNKSSVRDDPGDILTADERKARWEALLDLPNREWVVVYPLQINPADNYKPRHLGRPMANVERFNPMSYLQVPGEKIRPPCLICPRMLAHEGGQCQLGDPICYESLSFKSYESQTQLVKLGLPKDWAAEVQDDH